MRRVTKLIVLDLTLNFMYFIFVLIPFFTQKNPNGFPLKQTAAILYTIFSSLGFVMTLIGIITQNERFYIISSVLFLVAGIMNIDWLLFSSIFSLYGMINYFARKSVRKKAIYQ